VKNIEEYEDIISLEHHVSLKHPQMPIRNRAAQFAPFAALSGYDSEVQEAGRLTTEMIELSEDSKVILDLKQQMLLEYISSHPDVIICFFVPDKYKYGGSYQTITGTLKDIDELEKVVVLTSGEKIPIGYIYDIGSSIFEGVFTD